MQVSGRGDSSLQEVLKGGVNFGFFVLVLFLIVGVLGFASAGEDNVSAPDFNSTPLISDVLSDASPSAYPYPTPIYPPISIENLTLSPDPFKVYNASKDWVKYTDVFGKNMTCSFTIKGPTDAGTTLMVETNIIVQNEAIGKLDRPVLPRWLQYKEYKNGEKGNITFESKYIFPNDTIICNVTVNDLKGRVVNNLSNNVTMPTFDLYIKKVEILNTVEGVNLIKGREAVVRVWPSFESNLIKILDIPVNITYSMRYRNSNDILDKSEKLFEVRKYPDVEVMKINLETEVFPGLKAKDVLKKFIKNANDSVNFRTKKLTEFDAVYVSAEINKDKIVKENNITVNTLSTIRGMDSQQKDIRIIVIIAGNNITLDANKMKDIRDSVKYNLNLVTTVTPLTKENTKVINMNNLFGYTVSIKNLPALNWGETKSDGTPVNDSAYHEGKFTYDHYLVSEVEKIRMDAKADIAMVYVMEPNFFHNPQSLGQTQHGGFAMGPSSVSYVLMNYQPIVRNAISGYDGILAHELGHLIGDMEEQYLISNSGISGSSIIGIPTKEQGWDFRGIEQFETGKPIINIWTNNFKPGFTGSTIPNDVPEDRVPFEPSMGYARYFNIMGNSNTREWIDKYSFNKFLTKLEDRGFFYKTT
ncbi:MAG: hypothetical protein WCP89_00175 [archaeon]